MEIMGRTAYFVMAALILALCGCVREQNPGGTGTEDGEGILQVGFGASGPVEIETRATLDEENESRINNFYVFIFRQDGRIAGSQFFDAKNRKTEKELVTSSLGSSWYVDNSSNGQTAASGIFRIKSGAGTGMKVYMLANLDAEIFNVSSSLLSHAVETEEDLLRFTGRMSQLTVNRSGALTMTGVIGGVEISGAGDSKGVEISECDTEIVLRRVSAKVRFIFKTGDRPDEKGQVIKSFRPGKWKVVNVPRSSYLFSYADRGVSGTAGNDICSPDPSSPLSDYSQWAGDFYNTDYSYFEDFPSNEQAEFSFYMLENRQLPKKACTEWRDRDRCVKDDAGHNGSYTLRYEEDGVDLTRDVRLFEYANDFSTYVVATGEVDMVLKDDPDGTVLGGDVRYIIHLGDWSAKIDGGGAGDRNDEYSGIDNYNVERNTSYTYTVTVNSVNSIRVEVATSNDDSKEFEESQPGATGDITIAKEEILVCDSHYSSRTLNFSLANFFDAGGDYIGDKLTWFTETPFATGGPENGLDNVDYGWVHFRLNKSDADGNYSGLRRKYVDRPFVTYQNWRTAGDNKEGDGTDGLAGYHNDGIMDVQQLVDYIKAEVRKYHAGSANAFDHKESASLKDKCIKVTAFIDEYYYDREPLRPYNAYPTLWKKFVNKDDRKMHILSNSQESLDKESLVTGSVVTIQQKSIASIYDTDESNTGLTTAWGVESVDEFEGTRTYWSTSESEWRGNSSSSDGLRNTCVEWGLGKDWNGDFISGKKWADFMSLERENGVTMLDDEHNYLRYACMERNRDNNGDGIIDRSEVRWYLASIDQLVGLFMGNDVLEEDVRLYNRNPEMKASSDVQKWQQHVISSTSYGGNSNNPLLVWAEEGISTGPTSPDYQEIKKANVRCVRNLGYVGRNSDNTYPLNENPQNHIRMDVTEDGNYLFSADYIDEMAIRYYTSGELAFADETSVENRVYRKFEAYKDVSYMDSKAVFSVYNANISRYVSQGRQNPYCPDGYRTPNQMEVAIMKYYLPSDNYTSMSRTYWSMGPLGANHSGAEGKYGFIQNADRNVTVNNQYIDGVRCVRDVR